jgi:ribosomal protein S18 acetylase RimI-like enzyme
MSNIREAHRRGAEAAADRAFVDDLGARTVMTSVASSRPTTGTMARAAFERLRKVVGSQSHLTLIAEHDGRRAGFLLLLDALPDEVTALPQGFVAYMAVEPAAQHQGIGAALLAAAESEAKRRGLPYMALMVTDENVPALGLYERRGYRTERRLLCKRL